MGVGFEDVVLGFLLVTRGGDLLKHALGVLLLAWRRMLLVGAAALVGGLLVGEMAAVVASGRIPPPLMAQVVIAIFAVVIAYAASMTVFLEEVVQGIIATIRLIEGDVTAGARAMAVIAEREAGDVGTGLMRLFGAKPAPAAAAPTPVATGAMTSGGTLGETEDAIAATEDFVTTAPRPRVDARPVRADQLPRIGWAAEADQASSAAAATAVSAPIPPLPEARSSVQSPPLPSLPVRTPSQSLPLPDAQQDTPPPTVAAPATRPLPAEAAETWAPPSAATALPPGEQETGAFGARGRPTQPLSRPNSQPLDAGADNQSGRGVWSRTSQPLVGKIDEPTGGDGGEVSAGEDASGGEDTPRTE